MSLRKKPAILPKIGGTLPLASGLGLGILQTCLFREAWYMGSIGLFFVILIILAVLLPSGIKRQLAELEKAEGDELPDSYRRSRRRSARLEAIANAAVILSLALMVTSRVKGNCPRRGLRFAEAAGAGAGAILYPRLFGAGYDPRRYFGRGACQPFASR